MRAISGGRSGRLLARQLRAAVHRLRVRRIVLAVRPIEGAVEDVVGADVDEMDTEPFACRRQVADGIGIHGEGQRFVGLTRVDGGVRRGVDHRVGANRVEELTNGHRIGDVEDRLVDGDHVVADRFGMHHHVDSELTSGARDEELHRRTIPWFGLRGRPCASAAPTSRDGRGTTRRSRRASRRTSARATIRAR